ALTPRSLLFPYTTLFRSSLSKSSKCSSPTETLTRFGGVVLSGPSTPARRSMRLSTPPRLVALVKKRRLDINRSASSASPLIKNRSEEHTSELQSRENLVC